MSANINTLSSKSKHILMVVANSSTSITVGGAVGFWASELIHAWHEFTKVGYEVTIASPAGGKVEFDRDSDPRDPGGYSAWDILSMGFIHTPKLMALLDNTQSLNDVKVGDYDAIVVAGGQSPMFTFPTATRLHQLMAEFYESKGA
jgi:putative intracellular protease/amidase